MKKNYHIPCILWELDPEGYHLILNAKIKGQAIRLLIDTGANHSCFDRQFIENLQSNYPIEGSDELNVGIGGSDFETAISSIHNLQISRIKIPTLTIRLIDLQPVNQMYEQTGFSKIHGILGGDFLKKMNAVIDYSIPQITLYK